MLLYVLILCWENTKQLCLCLEYTLWCAVPTVYCSMLYCYSSVYACTVLYIHLHCSLPKAGLLSRIQETFNCIVCQEVVYQPVTTTCSYNICKVGNHWLEISLCLCSVWLHNMHLMNAAQDWEAFLTATCILFLETVYNTLISIFNVHPINCMVLISMSILCKCMYTIPLHPSVFPSPHTHTHTLDVGRNHWL